MTEPTAPEEHKASTPGRLLYWGPLMLFGAIALLAFVMLSREEQGQRDTSSIGFSMEGGSMPELVLQPLENSNEQINLAAWKGRAYGLNIFASWCAPCRAEAPAIAALAEKLPMVGISYKDKAADSLRFLEQYGNPFSAIGRDEEGQAVIQLGVYGVPETFIIDGEGRIILHHRGPILGETMQGPIREALLKLGIKP